MRNDKFRIALIVIIILTIVVPLNSVAAGHSGQLSKPISDKNLGKVSTAGNSVLEIAAEVSAGGFHTCAITTSGGVKCWGNNTSGELGDGTVTNRSTPVDVIGLSSEVSAVVAGWNHTCALTTSGGVKCWGANFDGQLGNGTTTYWPTPVDVVGLTSGVSAISAGYYHTCALTISSGVKCWGYNPYGQLGDGTKTMRLSPVDVSGLTSGVNAINAGSRHTCALTVSGGVKCWGNNITGQLGNGTTTDHPIPVDVSGLANGVSAIAVGMDHTCALTTSGGVKCWGYNLYGQLGDGTKIMRLSPVDVNGLTSGVSGITAGGAHTCALPQAGGVKCWGFNEFGQLGNGTPLDYYISVDVSGLASGVSAISAGSFHTCALTTTGGVKCWGDNGVGQLGNGTTTRRTTPMDVQGLASGVTAIVTGEYHTCALTTSGGVKCRGYNRYGQLGDGTKTMRLSLVDVVGLTSGVNAINAGSRHTCALTGSGGVKCWGSNTTGQLGNGTTTDYPTPVDVVGLSTGVSAIVAGGVHTCVLTTASGVKCWGNNGSGQLGDGTTSSRSTPVDVVGLTSGVSAISAGRYHTCALTTTGGVKCWGGNVSGQLGNGTIADHSTSVDVQGLASGVSAITARENHTCGLTTSGGIKCWGDNSYGQLGDGTTGVRLTPVDVQGLTNGVSAITAGWNHTCALTTYGGVECWGYNEFGQLGNGTIDDEATSVDVQGLASGVSAVAGGGRHTCALTQTGGVKCWGDNSYGQISNTVFWVPVDVVGFGGGQTRTPQWLLMFYIAWDDDNLSPKLGQMIDRLKKFRVNPNYGSNPYVDIAFMVDGKAANDSKYCFITNIELCEPRTEINTGDPQELINFINWASQRSSAPYRSLTIDDHGNLSGTAFDGSQNDYLDNREVVAALNDATGLNGKIDVTYLSSCLMSHIEIAYELQPYTDYLIASENPSWTTIPLYPFQIDGSTTPEILSYTIAGEYGRFESTDDPFPYTISVGKLSNLPNLSSRLQTFSNALNARMSSSFATFIRDSILNEVQRFDADGSGSLSLEDESIDLYDFARLVNEQSDDQELKAAAQGVMNAIQDDPVNKYIIYNDFQSGSVNIDLKNFSYLLNNSHGLSVYFIRPNSKRSFYIGDNFSFAMGTNWHLIPTNQELTNVINTEEIGWGSMLVSYTETLYPDAMDDPTPPDLVSPLDPHYKVYLPIIKR